LQNFLCCLSKMKHPSTALAPWSVSYIMPGVKKNTTHKHQELSM
jgi:hypothetical protein